MNTFTAHYQPTPLVLTRFSLVGPTKVKACKSFVLAQEFPVVENKECLFDLTSTFFNHIASMHYAVAKCHNQLKLFTKSIKETVPIHYCHNQSNCQIKYYNGRLSQPLSSILVYHFLQQAQLINVVRFVLLFLLVKLQ